jgi:predicted ATP-dependent Lon-type protease
VLLTDSELEKLKSEFPNDFQERIDKLSMYIESSGKAYKSHFATLKLWDSREKQKQPEKKSDPQESYKHIHGVQYL